ncbi:hypothetical protein [Selenomonas sp. F0473]|uniref:hypothetical protein n=1 Tax=Selenomonas sp. F0473 TaxID=999423 RepID=UPI0025FC4DBD|nr:hypothetical protein [Selenomonas sp. F0473]
MFTILAGIGIAALVIRFGNDILRALAFTLFAVLFLCYAVFDFFSDMIFTVLTTPPLLAFVIASSAVVVLLVQKFAKYQKEYFARHMELRR